MLVKIKSENRFLSNSRRVWRTGIARDEFGNDRDTRYSIEEFCYQIKTGMGFFFFLEEFIFWTTMKRKD